MPLEAPAGTAVLICESETNEKEATVPPNFTWVTPVKWLPLIVTVVPTAPNVGLNPVTGPPGTVTVKLVELCAVATGVITEMLCPWLRR